MNTFHDQSHRCVRHPYRPAVGVCASCVRDRLAALEKLRIRNASPSSLADLSSEAPGRRRTSRPAAVDNSSAGLAVNDKERVPNLALQTLKSNASAAASPERNHRSVSPHSHHRNKSLPSRRSDASESEGVSKVEVDVTRKESTSLWSLFQNGEEGSDLRSKANMGRSSSSLRRAEGRNHCPPGPRTKESQEVDGQEQLSLVLRSPGYNPAGSKPKEEKESSCRQTYTADLKAITERRGFESAVKVDVDHSDGTSWISSLFQRKKSRSKSISVGKNCMVETGSNGFIESSRSSFDAGRLSSDGGRPNFRQILKKQEAERKQSLADRTAQELDFANRCRHPEREDLESSQKNGNVILNLSERSSVSTDIPNEFHGKLSRCESRAEERHKDPASTSHHHQPTKQVIQGTAARSGEALEDGDRLSRSRSWGRTWSKTLSPLLGFKQRNRKGATKDEGQPPSCTPDHNQTSAHQSSNPSKDSGAAFSFYFSPLRRSRRAGRSIRLPQ